MRTINRTIVSALIFSKDGKLLLGMKDPRGGGVYIDCWHIPGGGTDENETLEDALRREILEEVGIDINVAVVSLVDDKGIGESERKLETGETVLAKMQFNVYRVDLSENAEKVQLTLGDDLKQTAWVSIASLKSYKLTPPSVELFSRLGYL